MQISELLFLWDNFCEISRKNLSGTFFARIRSAIQFKGKVFPALPFLSDCHSQAPASYAQLSVCSNYFSIPAIEDFLANFNFITIFISHHGQNEVL